jgi:hypothetical protein
MLYPAGEVRFILERVELWLLEQLSLSTGIHLCKRGLCTVLQLASHKSLNEALHLPPEIGANLRACAYDTEANEDC